MMGSREKAVRHTRVLDIRSKIAKGWSLEKLHYFCINNLKVSPQTADSYINEAAEPFRKKYEQENPQNEN